jgi:hypothetical protein
MRRFELRTNSRDDAFFHIHIVHDEEERRQQRLKDFKKVIEIYCENLKSRTSQSTGHNTKKEEKI